MKMVLKTRRRNVHTLPVRFLYFTVGEKRPFQHKVKVDNLVNNCVCSMKGPVEVKREIEEGKKQQKEGEQREMKGNEEISEEVGGEKYLF